MSKIETRFLILLVNYSRAGSNRYKQILKEEIEEVKEKSRELKNRVKHNLKITEEAKSILYSNWYFLAIWSLTAIDEFTTIEKIAERLSLNLKKAKEALKFLLKYNLVLEENGILKIGPDLPPENSTSLKWRDAVSY